MALFFSKCISIYLVFVVMVVCKSQATSSTPNKLSIAKRHEQWMTRYGKAYNSTVEKDKRFKIFKANVEFIDTFNIKGNQPYKLDVNAFADLTNQEFIATHTGYKRSKPKESTSFKYENFTDVPYTTDWRTEGAVTPIQDQGYCASGWAFSAVAAVEGINQLTTGKLISLSAQELIDCDYELDYNYGCDGGFTGAAFFFIKRNGITTDTLYPYKGVDEYCPHKMPSAAANITGFEYLPENNESALLKAVANQPISVTIDASGSAFRFYSSGVFTGDCGTDLNHGVTIVGYGSTSDGTKYWIVKNSWGTEWGENGYMLMERDISTNEGICGIAVESSYPTA